MEIPKLNQRDIQINSMETPDYDSHHKFSIYKQQGINDCGIACIQMLCSYFGITKPFFSDDFSKKTSHQGISLFTLIEIAASFEIECKAYRGTYEEFLANISLPCIVLWHGKHYVVVYEKTHQMFKIADPALGSLELTPQQFQQNWFLSKTQEGIAISCSKMK